MKIDYLETDQANELRATLRGLPEGTKIHGIYSRGMKHFAWVSTPPESESTAIPNPSAQAIPAPSKKRK